LRCGADGRFVDFPEVVEGATDGHGLDVGVGGGGHVTEAWRTREEGAEGFGPGGGGVGGKDEAGFVWADDLLGAAFVRDEDWEAGGLGFHDDLAEGVGGGGEREEVGGGVDGGELGAVAEAGEVGVEAGEIALHSFAVRAVADDNEGCRMWDVVSGGGVSRRWRGGGGFFRR